MIVYRSGYFHIQITEGEKGTPVFSIFFRNRKTLHHHSTVDGARIILDNLQAKIKRMKRECVLSFT